MKKYFDDVTSLYADFKNLQKRLDDNYKAMSASGTYSKSYLLSLQDSNKDSLNRKRSDITKRIGEIEAEYKTALKKANDLTKYTLPAELKNIFDSGISLSVEEWSDLARKNSGNVLASRAISERAKAQGITTENLVPIEESVKAFDDFVNLVKRSIAPDAHLNWHVAQDIEQLGIYERGYIANALEPTMKVYKTPTTPEEELAKLVLDEHEAEEKRSAMSAPEAEQAFLAGFNGVPEQPVGDLGELEERDLTAGLTEQEVEDAGAHSILKGRGGNIDASDIEYLQSDLYKQVLAKRETHKEQE